MTKVFLSFILITLFLLLTPTVFAQSPIPTYVSPTSPIYTDLLVHNLFHTFSCLTIGSSVIGKPCLTYQITQNAQGVIKSVPVLSQTDLSGGALGGTTSLIGLLYKNPPVRTIDYLASVGQGFGFVKEAHAQVGGSGAGVLSPILKLWETSRNFSYVFMIIIFVIIGLMVMFRQRINPQTVITAQAALPGLVIGLVMITFSFFLAGLISDMAFVGTNVVGYYFGTARNNTSQNLLGDLNSTNPDTNRRPNLIGIFSKFATVANKEKVSAVLDSFWEDINLDAQRLLTMLAAFMAMQVTGQGLEVFKAVPRYGEGIIAGIQLLFAGSTASDPKATVGLFLGLVVTAILLYSMFKLLLRLINVYLSIIFATITAPFQFMAAALPGRQGIATSWILNMLANILAFPAVLAVFYFVAFLLGPNEGPFYPFKISAAEGVQAGGLFPLAQAASAIEVVGANSFPLFGGIDLTFIKMLLAFGALVATPAIPDIINKTIGRVGVAGQLIGQELSGGISQGRGYGQQFQQGAGSLSAQGARARGLFGEEAYMPSVDATGKQKGWAINPYAYRPNILEKAQARRQFKSTGPNLPKAQ